MKVRELTGERSAEYLALKENILTDIFWYIKDQIEGEESTTMDLAETKDCPAVVTQVINDQESEVIHELYIKGPDVIAKAGVYEDNVEYNLNTFEIPMLLSILESVEGHLKE
jgi:hypothetical protein